MSSARLFATALVVGCLCSFGSAVDPQFFPESCAQTCADPSSFTSPLPPGPTGTSTRPGEWAIVTLNQIKANLGTTSPPGVGRALAVVSLCIYEAVSLFESEGLNSWAATDFMKIGAEDNDKMGAVVDGAAFTALQGAFSGFGSFSAVPEALQAINGGDVQVLLTEEATAAKDEAKAQALAGFSGLSPKMALAVGASACDAVIAKFTADGYDVLARPLPGTTVTPFEPINDPQVLSGVTNCEREMVDFDRWQPLCTPREKKPLADVGNPNCKVQEWLAPWAGGMTPFAAPAGSPQDGRELIAEVAAVDSTVMGGPPSIRVGLEWQKQMMEVVDASSQLDDIFKLIAEHWADGPDSTAPPGTWYLIAKDAADSEGLSMVDTAKLLMMVGTALNDAGVTSWRLKSTFDSVRPLQMIQCGFFGQPLRKVDAWRGPYQGVGPTRVDEWQPFQLDTFKTPPFAGYVSGHSTFSAAAAEVLNLFFGGDEYKGPKCTVFKEGSSTFERKIVEGEAGYIAGVTDVANNGPRTVGYSPASDVTLCWDTFSAASAQAGESRVYGGIHVRADDVDGGAVGKQVARAVFVEASKLFNKETDVESIW